MKIINRIHPLLFRTKVIFIVAVLSVTAFTPVDTTNAKPVYDLNFFSKNDIYLYNPKDVGCPASADGGKLSGSDNEEKIWNYLTNRALSPEQAAGVLGNIKTESGQTYSPTINEFSKAFPEGGYGIVQWTGGRRDAVVAYLTAAHPDLMEKYYNADYSSAGAYTGASSGFVSKNKNTGELMPVEDNDKLLLSQLEFLVSESLSRNLHSPAIEKGYGTAEDKEWNVLLKQKTIEDASNVWVYSFEIPADIDTTAVARAKNGQEIFDLYNTGGSGGGGGCGNASNDKKQLAQEILDSGNLRHSITPAVERNIIPNIAAGTNDGNTWPCGMNINILRSLAAMTKENVVTVSSLNRGCSDTVPAESSTRSRHYAGNGSAIDFDYINSLFAEGPAQANLILQYMAPFFVDGSRVGQSQGSCLPSIELPAGVAIGRLPDACTHLHVDFPPNSDPTLQCKVPIVAGGCDNPI